MGCQHNTTLRQAWPTALPGLQTTFSLKNIEVMQEMLLQTAEKSPLGLLCITVCSQKQKERRKDRVPVVAIVVVVDAALVNHHPCGLSSAVGFSRHYGQTGYPVFPPL